MNKEVVLIIILFDDLLNNFSSTDEVGFVEMFL